MTRSEEPRPLRYELVRDLVLRMIAEQGLVPGDRLPSTSELGRLAGVSQISVRRALDELERAGRIQRHQGLGTFVATPRILSEPARAGDLLATLGESDARTELTTELVGLRVGLPGATIAGALRLSEGQPVWEVHRRRLMGGAPVIVERAVLPLHLVQALDERWLREGRSLYRFLEERYGLVDTHEEQYLEVTSPTVAERELLGLTPREQVIAIKGVSFDSAGTPFDCFHQVYPARRFGFYVSGSQERRLLEAREGDDWSVNPLTGN